MALNYGLLKGTVSGHLRDADDDHYQILVHAGDEVFRIAVNVKSSAPHAPSTVLFESRDTLPDSLSSQLMAAGIGFTKLASKPGGLAIDFVRGGLVDSSAMVPVPPDAPGQDNDLKDRLESAVVKAMSQAGSQVFAFGSKWGPEDKPDQYFKFVPGQGVHDIHMNQGNSGSYRKDNGVYQDGCLILHYPDDTWLAVFLAFQSQSFDTDDHGNPR
ncbi:YukJ family protein [Burkholderia gladioli]|uniref:YukJ family protein n=1 Tax=Burkholderia gladioli TaxID=28095 RepID=UPI00064B671E|nr:YukJ family protein [Burkholderia gladioli]MDA0569732.1 YukJ family protein [Burkholderia gladioli]MDA0597776.1 YukJ family protein [Burkholderia gladioli]